MKSVISLLIIMAPILANALTFSGKISKTDNSLVKDPAAKFWITLQSGNCVLYSEYKEIDMSSGDGIYNIEVGTGIPSFANNGLNVFAGKEYNCQDGSKITPTSVELKAIASINGNAIDAGTYKVPKSGNAYQADELNGLGSDKFVQVKDSVSQESVKVIVDLTTQIQSLLSGGSTQYAKPSDIPTQVDVSGKMDKSSNLNDLTNKAAARSNLELGALATKATVGDSEISDMSYSKLSNVPLSFNPSVHSHVISDVSGLQFALNEKVPNSKINALNCTPDQTVKYNSASDSFSCQSITVSQTQVSGLGSLATKSSIDYSSDEVINKPTLGSLALKSAVEINEVNGLQSALGAKVDSSSLGLLAAKNSINESDISGTISTTRLSGVITQDINSTNVTAENGSFSSLKIATSTDSAINIKSPLGSFSSYSLTLPNSIGSNGQVLQLSNISDSSADLTWVNLPSAPVSSVAGKTGAVTLSAADISDLSAVATMSIGSISGTVAAGDDARIVNAVQSNSQAGGDVSGTFSNLSVTKLGGSAISFSQLESGNFLKFDSSTSNWINSPINIGDIANLQSSLSSKVNSSDLLDYMTQSTFNTYVSSASCSNGQTMYWNSVSGNFQCQDISVTLAGDVSGSIAAVSVDKIKGIPVNFSTTPTASQVLKFDGANWVASEDNNTGGTVTSVGSANDDISVATSSSTPILTLNSGIVGGSNDANKIAKLDANGLIPVGMIPNIDATKITTGTINQDVSSTNVFAANGTFSNISIFDQSSNNRATFKAPQNGFTNNYTLSLPSSTGSNGQVLQLSNSSASSADLSWADLPSAPVTSVAGKTGVVTLLASDISDLGGAATMNIGTTTGTVAAGDDSRITGALQSSAQAGGDISGSFSSLSVIKLSGETLSFNQLTSGHFLKYDGANWINSVIGVSDVSGLQSLLSSYMTQSEFNGYVTNANCLTSQSLYWNSVSGNFLCQNVSVNMSGDVTGENGAAQVVALQGKSIDAAMPANGQVLGWNSSTSKWTPTTLPNSSSGTVTNVSSANRDIAVANENSAPILTLNSGTVGGSGDADKIAKLDSNGLLATAMIPNLDAGKIATGNIPVARGGTGASSLAGNGVIVMNSAGTSATSIAASTAGNVLTSDGTTWKSSAISVSGSSLTGNIATNAAASGVVNADFSNANTVTLTSLSGSSLSASGLRAGGSYSIIIEDPTSRTFSFASTLCTGGIKYVSDTSVTSVSGTYSIVSILVSNSMTCYVGYKIGL